MIPPQSFQAVVVSNEYIAKETRKTIFEVQNTNLTFHTGQFVNLKVEPKVMRAYSVASSSARLPRFELCVKVVENGKGSGYIDRMNEGDVVEFMGPFGHFGRKDTTKKVLLLGTGTGIAPLKAICDDEKEKGFPVPVTLIYGVKSEEFVCYDALLKQYQLEFPQFSYSLWVSQPSESFSGNHGRITQWIQTMDSSYFKDTEILMCGNPAMIKEAKTILMEQKSVPKEDIIFEAF